MQNLLMAMPLTLLDKNLRTMKRLKNIVANTNVDHHCSLTPAVAHALVVPYSSGHRWGGTHAHPVQGYDHHAQREVFTPCPWLFPMVHGIRSIRKTWTASNHWREMSVVGILMSHIKTMDHSYSLERYGLWGSFQITDSS
ncbi:hypothetical protein Mapa_010264 [Marchantia paleacea]|nr:hypothetical protein Mapa_010264 [Marchantia paleacea]